MYFQQSVFHSQRLISHRTSMGTFVKYLRWSDNNSGAFDLQFPGKLGMCSIVPNCISGCLRSFALVTVPLIFQLYLLNSCFKVSGQLRISYEINIAKYVWYMALKGWSYSSSSSTDFVLTSYFAWLLMMIIKWHKTKPNKTTNH